MNIQSILAVTDFSVKGQRALERAALLAVTHGASLKLMHAVLDGSPSRADALDRLVQLARQLARKFDIGVDTVRQAENTPRDIAVEACAADLLVLGHEHKRSLATVFQGHPAVQLMRLCPCPILVARLDAGERYSSILVAVNLAPASKNLVQMACVLDGDAEIELFHALSTRDEAKLRSAEVSVDAIKTYRQACIRHAQGRIFSLTDSFDARRNRVMSTIERGDPARQAVIQQQYTGAGLLVVGNRRQSRLMDFLAGSVAQRVLSWSTCDLLLVPHDFQVSTRTTAKLRSDAGRGEMQSAFLTAQKSLP